MPWPSRARSTSSSDSTRDLPSEPPLWIVLACEDSPKVCTGRKALRLGLAREAGGARRPSPRSVLLDPHSDIPLSPQDARSALEGGIVAVDCSWNRLGRRGGYPLEDRWLSSMRVRRRLPFLFAANPQHYGRLGELNTAEALGAALYVVAGRETAETFLGRFAFGASFLDLNGEALEAYHRTSGPTEVGSLEIERFSGTGGPAGAAPARSSAGAPR